MNFRIQFFFILIDNEFLLYQIQAEILIKPYFCGELVVSGCVAAESQSIIYVKNNRNVFWVSSSMTIENVVFDGSDLHLNNNEKRTICNKQSITDRSDKCWIDKQESPKTNRKSLFNVQSQPIKLESNYYIKKINFVLKKVVF